MTEILQFEPSCCPGEGVHYHCEQCDGIVGQYGHRVFRGPDDPGRIICDPAERRAYREGAAG